MDSSHVIALIASIIKLRRTINGDMVVQGDYSEEIAEAKGLIDQVVADIPKFPEAPNTMARNGPAAV